MRENEMKEIQMRNEHIRNKMRSDFKRVQEFSRGWEREGVKNWGGNMEVRKNQEMKDREWRVKMEAKGKEGREGREEREGKEVERDIDWGLLGRRCGPLPRENAMGPGFLNWAVPRMGC